MGLIPGKGIKIPTCHIAKRKEDLEKRERGFGKNREENLKGRQVAESKNAFCAGSREALELPLRRTSEQPGKLCPQRNPPTESRTGGRFM